MDWCGANQWTGFYMITASVMKGLKMIENFKLKIKNYQKIVLSLPHLNVK